MYTDATLQPGGRTPFGGILYQPLCKQASPHPPQDNRQRLGTPGRPPSEEATVANRPQRLSSAGSVNGPRAADSDSCNVPHEVIKQLKEIQERETGELLQVFEEHQVCKENRSVSSGGNSSSSGGGGCTNRGSESESSSDSGDDSGRDHYNGSNSRNHPTSSRSECSGCDTGSSVDKHANNGKSNSTGAVDEHAGGSGSRRSHSASAGGSGRHHSSRGSDHHSRRDAVRSILHQSCHGSHYGSSHKGSLHKGRSSGKNLKGNAIRDNDSDISSSRQHHSLSLERDVCQQADFPDAVDAAA